MTHVVLVTGGAGFIGSHVVDRLLQHGHRVIVLDDLSSGKRSNLPGDHARLELIHGSIAETAKWSAELRNVTAIVHLAALISGYESLDAPDEYFRINVQGLLRVLELCGALDKPRFVFASSSTVYGNVPRAAQREDALPSPATIYALTKLVGEHTLAMYRERYGYDDVSLRLFNVYGPRQNPDHPYANVTCKFARAAAQNLPVKLYGDGEQTRDFIYVDDVADVIVASLENRTPARLYNVGTGEVSSIGALLGLAQRLAGTELTVEHCPPWPNDIRSIRADITRLRKDLEFAPKTKLEEGLRRTIDWFSGNG